MKELIIYCDESTKDGPFYSNFYGGALVSSSDIENLIKELDETKRSINLFQEVKWTRVTETYLDKYITLISRFFDFVESGMIKIRIMFSKNAFEAKGLSQKQIDNRYYLLYYQFIKHTFGLKYSNPTNEIQYLRLFFDVLPDKKEQSAEFKRYIFNLQCLDEFRSANLKIRFSDIAEVDSKKHTILQCIDIILGAMQFRLNNLHMIKPAGFHNKRE